MKTRTAWCQPWALRSAEEARIFNPAFCSELISRTVDEYHRTGKTPLSYMAAFLVLPLTLHKPTREVLPRRANTAFAGWVAEQAPLLVELPERTKRLQPISREALLFALRYELLSLDGAGLLPGANAFPRNVQLKVTTDEVTAVRSASALLGRWFARQGAQISVLRGLGITP